MAKLRCIFDRHVMLPPHFRWNDAISSFCGKEAFAFLADRFGYLNQFTRINAAAISEGKLPSFASTIDFSTCMGSRAAELLARCERDGCHCYVLWSGGCDSTGVLSALISVGFPRGMLTVLYTKSSLEENPEFFSFIQSLGFAVELVTARTMFTVALSYASRGDIVLTGFPADQLFGSVIGQSLPYDTTKTHWTKFLSSDTANQQYEAAFEHYGIPVKTVAEFLWFNNFALKWDFVNNFAVISEHATHSNIIPFFNTKQFEDWSASNFDVLHSYDQKNIGNYKIQMKDYISSVTGLKSIYMLKKVPSVNYAFSVDGSADEADHRISGIDDEGTIVTAVADIRTSRRELTIAHGFSSASIMRRYLKK